MSSGPIVSQPGGGAAANSYDVLRQRVQEKLRTSDIDGERESERVRELIWETVGEFQRAATAGMGGLPLKDPQDMATRIGRSVLGFGPLEQFLGDDTDVVEVEVRGSEISWKDERGRWHTNEEPTSESELRAVIDRMLQPTGRALTEAHPIVSTQVLDRQVRLTASIPPISDVLECNLRFYRIRWQSLHDLVAMDTLTQSAANFCWALMRHPKTGVLVSGRPQAGKTTFANALLKTVPGTHKVACCEDTREMYAPLMHISYRKTRPRTGLAEGEAEVSLRDLVALTLRSSPERIVVGEVRGAEAAELTRAANAGSALLCTLHAHAAADALDSLVNAALLGDHGMPSQAVRSIFSRTIDVVIHLDSEDIELHGGSGDERRPIRRQVMEIAAVTPLQGNEEHFTVIPIFERPEVGAPLVWSRNPLPAQLQARMDLLLRRYGTTTQAVLDGQEVIRQ